MAREVIGGLIKKSPHNKNYKELYDIVYNLKGRFVLKGAVQTYNELLDTHPEPHIGDAVHVIDDFRIYRWNGEEWEVSIDLSDLEIAENERIANEIIRVASENTRIENEDSRVTEENIRKTSEITRVENEEARELNENTRQTKEQERVGSETDRQLEEGIRQANEQTRVENESIRVFAEDTRIANEDDRKLNEQLRQDNEIIREQLKHIGEYQSTSVYSKNNMVIYNGSTFMALKNIPIDTPPNVNLDTEYWQRVALRGDIGIERRLSSLEEEVYEANYSPELENTSSIFSLGTGKDENGSDIDVSGSVVKGQVRNIVIKGNTRTNLLGDMQTWKSPDYWNMRTRITVDSAVSLYGAESLKMTPTDSVGSGITKDITGLNPNHKYMFSGYVNISSHTSGRLALRKSDYNTWANVKTVTFDTTKINRWQRASVIISDMKAARINVDTIAPGNLIANIDGLMLYDLTEIYGVGNEPTDIAQLERELGFTDDTKSTVGASRIKSVGKNLLKQDLYSVDSVINIQKNNDTFLLSWTGGFDAYMSNQGGKIKVPKNTDMHFSVKSKYVSARLVTVIFGDNGDTLVSRTLSNDNSFVDNKMTFNTGNSEYIIIKFIRSPNSVGAIEIKEMYLGIIDSEYEPYTESTLYITAKKGDKIVNLRSLPNGTKDEVSEGQVIKRVSDEVDLQSNNVTSVIDRANFTQANVPFSTLPFAPFLASHDLQGTFRVDGWNEKAFNISGSYVPNLFQTREDGQLLVFDLPLGTTLTQARQQLAGLTLTYQLAEPEIIPIETHGVLKSFGKGTTVYVEIAEDSTLPTILYKVPINMKAQLDDTTMCSLDNKERVQELEKTAHDHTNKQVLDGLAKNEDGFLTFEDQEISGDVRVANEPEQVIDDNIIFIGDTRPLEEMIERDYATKEYAKDYTDSQVALITETGIPKLTRLEYILRNVPVGTTTVQIPSDNFDGRTDTVDLYINTTHKNSDDYTYTEAGLITLAKPLEAVSTLTIHVLKNVPMGEDGSVSGKVIAVDSLPSDRVQGLDAHLAEAVLDDVHGLKPESPISITLLNGWTNQSISIYGEASYYKDAFGLVHLQGTIKAPSGNRTLTIFNLPQGYRPSRRKHLLVANATQASAGIMSITSDGDVNIESTTGDGNVISLNTVSFKAGE